MGSVERFGFDRTFGLLDVSVLSKEHLVNSDAIMERVSEQSKACYEECLKLLREHYDKVEEVATRLLEKETLTGEEINRIMEGAEKAESEG